MELIVPIIFAGILITISLIALIKDIKAITDEQKKQPIMLFFDLFLVMGLILFIFGVVIFDNLLLGNIAITLVIIGIVFDSIRYWKSNSISRKVRALGLAIVILVFYIYFYH